MRKARIDRSATKKKKKKVGIFQWSKGVNILAVPIEFRSVQEESGFKDGTFTGHNSPQIKQNGKEKKKIVMIFKP